jgi:hypothetical protein
VSENVYLFREKNARLVQAGTLTIILFASTLKPSLGVSYKVAYRIAKQNNSHPTTDILVKIFAL